MAEPTHAYIGRAACGCVVSGVVDRAEVRLSRVAEAVLEMIEAGETIERVPLTDKERLRIGHTCGLPQTEGTSHG